MEHIIYANYIFNIIEFKKKWGKLLNFYYRPTGTSKFKVKQPVIENKINNLTSAPHGYNFNIVSFIYLFILILSVVIITYVIVNTK